MTKAEKIDKVIDTVRASLALRRRHLAVMERRLRLAISHADCLRAEREIEKTRKLIRAGVETVERLKQKRAR